MSEDPFYVIIFWIMPFRGCPGNLQGNSKRFELYVLDKYRLLSKKYLVLSLFLHPSELSNLSNDFE